MAQHRFFPVDAADRDWHRCSRCGLRAAHYSHPMLPAGRTVSNHSSMTALLAPDVPFDRVSFPCSEEVSS